VFVAGIDDDFEGHPRPMDGTATPRGDGSDLDIGADEYMPPGTADAGPDSYGYESRGTEAYVAALDGSASTAYTYQWQQLGGIPVTLRNADTATPDFDAPQWDGSTELTIAEATLLMQLTVNEGSSSPSSDDTQLYVRIPGDSNGDDLVNAFDIALLRNLDPSADYTGDGVVNAFDLAVLRINAGRRRTE